MTLVHAALNNSYGVPIAGYIVVKLDYLVVNELTQESYLPIAAKVPLAAGEATMTLEPSEAARVTYLFEVYETVSSNQAGVIVITDVLRWSFRAKVPDSATPIELFDLMSNTGITHDTMDASLSSIVRRLYLSDDFWVRFQQQVVTPKGVFNPTTYYKRGNLVAYNGGSYVYINNVPDVNIYPTINTHWQQLAAKGDVGAGTTGNTQDYDATAWSNQVDAPSRGAVRNIIEQLATKAEVNTKVSAVNASLTTPVLASTIPPISDSSSKIVSTAWVQALVAEVKKAVTPVGMVAPFAGSSAPTGWLLCDGRAISRTTYAALFAVLGTQYGSTNATDFKIPDLRGRVATGLDATPTQADTVTRLNQAWSNTLGGSGGSASVVLTEAQLPAHKHAQNILNTAGGNIAGRVDLDGLTSTGLAEPQVVNTDNTGGGLGHPNIQPSICLYHIIYTGL